jgi:hypothetical protein
VTAAQRTDAKPDEQHQIGHGQNCRQDSRIHLAGPFFTAADCSRRPQISSSPYCQPSRPRRRRRAAAKARGRQNVSSLRRSTDGRSARDTHDP